MAPNDTCEEDEETSADTIERRIEEIMQQASKIVDLFASLANERMSREEAKAGGERMESIANILSKRKKTETGKALQRGSRRC